MKPQFEMVPGPDGKVYIHLKDKKGEILLSGRGYAHKHEAIKAIADIVRYASQDRLFRRKQAFESGNHYFQLVSNAGRIIGWSGMYHSLQGLENAIIQVRRIIQMSRFHSMN